MANCLILLAQGEGPKPTVTETAEKFSPGDFSGTVAVPTATRTGFYVYYCKTCKRSFPSFQALGGHRATHHRKPKATVVEEKKDPVVLPMNDHPDEDCHPNKSCSLDDPISHQIASSNDDNSNKSKIFRGKMAKKTHECSICGSQFTSGQALGGHMRRHRASAGNHMSAIIESVKTGEIKPRKILPLDLNLPAPENDDHHDPETETNFQFASKQQALVFSAPALVDCHY
uniref:Zinc finger protein ZAT5 n=1 Tax=Rhizophora mucronata TaxID=61149 RepID=A0A2P2JUI3_RHIMU